MTPRRPRLPGYVGAIGAALDPAAGLELGDSYGWMLKADGAYAMLPLDGDGRVAAVMSQTGEPLHGAGGLVGIVAGPPHSVLVGEYSGHTTAGIAEVAARGWDVVHLFDCLQLAGRDLSRVPYRERHGLLYTAHSWVEGEGLGRVREYVPDARGDAHDSAGRYVRATPRDLRRLPILPLVRGRAGARALWDEVERDGLEGLVACRLDAPIGARGAKRKIKLTDTLDGVVVSSDASHSLVAARIAGPRPRDLTFTIPGSVPPGSVVEVAHNGFYTSGLPRFVRLVRARRDKVVAQDRGGLVEWAA